MKAVYYLPDTKNPFWTELVSGMQAKARPLGIVLEVVSANHDASLQVSQLQDYGSREAEAVFVSPVDMKNMASLCKSIHSAGIPVFAIDQNLSFNVNASIVSGNMKGGIMAATFLADYVGPGKRLVHIKAEEGLHNVNMRSTSFLAEATRRGLQVVKALQANSSSDIAFAKMRDFLGEHKPFDAVFAENDAMALGGIRALSAVNYSPWPVIVGFDGVPEALEAIRKGKMHATIAQNPRLIGEKAIEVLSDALKGTKFNVPVTIFPSLVTQETVG